MMCLLYLYQYQDIDSFKLANRKQINSLYTPIGYLLERYTPSEVRGIIQYFSQ